MQKTQMTRKPEFILGIITAALLIIALLWRRYFFIPYKFIFFLLAGFIAIKIYYIIKRKGTIIEDYISLTILTILGVIDYFFWDKINTMIIVVMIFLLIYSIGLIPWIDTLIRSRHSLVFAISYALFVIMIIFLFAGMYFANNSEFNYNGQKTRLSFKDSFYFSTITFATVGYGDITPIGTNRLIATFQAITGMILNIAFIGYVLASREFKK